MHRTLYDKTTGEIINSANLSDKQLSKILTENPQLNYINLYTNGVKNIAVDVDTKKLKKVPPPSQNIAGLIRQRRIGLLNSSDWTQSLDSPLSESKRAEWAAYRQALRNLPDEQGNVNSIDDVVWPTSPQ
jgi:uncharacterized protein YabE (DUF348 family)